jgi:hypothetical protein
MRAIVHGFHSPRVAPLESFWPSPWVFWWHREPPVRGASRSPMPANRTRSATPRCNGRARATHVRTTAVDSSASRATMRTDSCWRRRRRRDSGDSCSRPGSVSLERVPEVHSAGRPEHPSVFSTGRPGSPPGAGGVWPCRWPVREPGSGASWIARYSSATCARTAAVTDESLQVWRGDTWSPRSPTVPTRRTPRRFDRSSSRRAGRSRPNPAVARPTDGGGATTRATGGSSSSFVPPSAGARNPARMDGGERWCYARGSTGPAGSCGDG